MNDIVLHNGVRMPQIGFGVFQIVDHEECKRCTLQALKAGYRMIDTAAVYGNERAVGEALRECGIDRKELFVVSKLWMQYAGYESTLKAFDKTLENLGLDYLDLYLIHFPYNDYHGTWRAMEELYRAGKIKAIGVSNFYADRLVDLILTHEIVPMVNQMETHPFHQQKELREVMAKYNVALTAWAPFAEGEKGLFTNETLTAIGKAHGKTAAQVTLRFLIQEGIIVIPKSVHEERIVENFNVDDFELTPAEMDQIRAMDEKKALIIDVPAVSEVYRLHGIKIEH